MSAPTVTVITPVGPGTVEYLEDAYASLREQTVEWEWRLQLDGPVGEVPAGITADERVSVEGSERPLGIAVCRNLCLAAAEAPYIATLDADDWYLPGALARLLRGLESDPEASMAWGRALAFGLDGRLATKTRPTLAPGPVGCGELYRAWNPSLASSRPPLVCAAALWRRGRLSMLGGWSALPVHEDIALVMRADAVGGSHYVDADVYVARRRPGQSTRDPDLLSRRAAEQRFIHDAVAALRVE